MLLLLMLMVVVVMFVSLKATSSKYCFFIPDPSIDNFDSRGNPIHLHHDNMDPPPGLDQVTSLFLLELPHAFLGKGNLHVAFKVVEM